MCAVEAERWLVLPDCHGYLYDRSRRSEETPRNQFIAFCCSVICSEKIRSYFLLFVSNYEKADAGLEASPYHHSAGVDYILETWVEFVGFVCGNEYVEDKRKLGVLQKDERSSFGLGGSSVHISCSMWLSLDSVLDIDLNWMTSLIVDCFCSALIMIVKTIMKSTPLDHVMKVELLGKSKQLMDVDRHYWTKQFKNCFPDRWSAKIKEDKDMKKFYEHYQLCSKIRQHRWRGHRWRPNIQYAL
ncbi:hypothetical protein PTKIN_Ptkin01aG0326300 [Pterospermum kingtungense]